MHPAPDQCGEVRSSFHVRGDFGEDAWKAVLAACDDSNSATQS